MLNWLLPEYIEDLLPAQAERLESARRAVLDLLRAHGYQLVIPPLLEYVESLLVGSGHDLDLATFKLVDQLSGRHMGIRADMTPQAARIDAHLMNRQGVNRLCYAGSVLRALPDGLMRTREPLQIGAELFGHAGIEGDIEIQRLLLETLNACGIDQVVLDLGHVGIFRAIATRANAPLEAELFRALQGKDLPELRALARDLDAKSAGALQQLAELSGGIDVLTRAKQVLPDYPEIRGALDELHTLAAALSGEGLELSFDLAELRGYHYHSGIVFAAYAHGYADAIAKGGRYDHVGKAFGRARPATGFSLDLRELTAGKNGGARTGAILAPYQADATLDQAIAALRGAGEIVIRDLPGHAAYRAELGCDRELVNENGNWRVKQRAR